MEKIIGFIGAGNMGQAMAGGIISSKTAKPENIIFSDTSNEKLKKVYEKYGAKTSNSNILSATMADIIVLSVKPNIYQAVIDEIKDYIKPETLVITIAAGITLEKAEKMFGKDIKIVRTMPNTPAMVGEGMTAVVPNKLVTDGELQEVMEILNSFGKAEIVEEKLIDSVIAVSGSSPAYVYMMIEAMADAAVAGGMTREKAYKFAAQAVYGSAKMVLETGMHPGELKDMVCSPAGTTIEAVAALEEYGFRNAVIKAMKICEKKSKEMSSK